MNKLFFALLLIAAGTGTGYVMVSNAHRAQVPVMPKRVYAVAGMKIANEGTSTPTFDPQVNCDQYTTPDQHEACLRFKQSLRLPPPPPGNCDAIQNQDEKATCLALKMVNTTADGIQSINCDQFTNAQQKQACLIAKQAAAKGVPPRLNMPFDCKNLSSGAQENCEVEKKKMDPCHDVMNGERRAQCAREMLGLATSTKADLLVPCRAATGTERALCEKVTKDKVKSLVQFHLDDLIEKAQMASGTMLKANVRSSTVRTIEKAKEDLGKAKTLAARNIILNRVKAAWKNITTRAKDKTVGNDTLNQAFSDIKKL